jgi:Raf kinase inhibitor-like YbhB/YbcL family protein
VNPPLQLSDIPAGAKSLVLIVDDPDAPGGLFTHWLVWNIDPATTHVGEKSVPPGAAQGVNDFGNSGYGGPCPPSGTHRYFFRLFALDQKLDLKSGAKRSALERALAGHVLARGELMGRFSH